MKLTLKLAFLFFSTLLGSCAPDLNHVKQKSKSDDQSRAINLLDGKRASVSEITQGFDNGSIELREYANNSRDALLQYGEKYRYGVYILVTKKEESSK